MSIVERERSDNDEAAAAICAFANTTTANTTTLRPAHILDAHGPHLGAHLGFGGTVAGGDIVCPFHRWHWSGEGTNTEIPYKPQPTGSGVTPPDAWA